MMDSSSNFCLTKLVQNLSVLQKTSGSKLINKKKENFVTNVYKLHLKSKKIGARYLKLFQKEIRISP